MHAKPPRLLFVTKSRTDHYGHRLSSGLFNSASMVVRTLRDHGLEAEIVDVPDQNAIDREVHRYRPTHVVLEALWATPQKVRELLRLHKGVNYVVRVHSRMPFLAAEGMALEWLAGLRDVAGEFSRGRLVVAPNTDELADELAEALGIHAVHLPNIYHNRHENPFQHRLVRCNVDVGCFGAVRLLKNQLLQATAAIRFAEQAGLKLRFHVNGGRVERGEEALRNMRALFAASRHELVEHPWMTHDAFLGVVHQMHACMQVSYTESFNIVAADAVSQSVPIVVSSDIEWMPDSCKVDVNSSKAMARWLARTVGEERAQLVADEARLSLHKNVRQATRAWLRWLGVEA